MLKVHDEMPRTHNELVDHLVDTKAVCTKKVEMAFRGVDRGIYYNTKDLDSAYKLLTWKSGLTNVPSPFVHAFALEFLELEPGHAFLNVGSGVGCLNIMAGLLLGPYGVNHGVEISSYLVKYAYSKLEQYKSNAAAMDYYDFCEPKFVAGNVIDLSLTGMYDRVYCGAVVEPEYQMFIRSLVKVGGILITMTVNEHLKCKRIDESTWSETKLFPMLVKKLMHLPAKFAINPAPSFTVEPHTLQDLCRFKVRSLLRDKLLNKYPSLQMQTMCTSEEYPLEEPEFIYADYMDTIFASNFTAEPWEFPYHNVTFPMLNNDIHFSVMSSEEIPATRTNITNLNHETNSEENETSNQQNVEPEPENARVAPTVPTISNSPTTSSCCNTSEERMLFSWLSQSEENGLGSVIDEIHTMTSDGDVGTCLGTQYEGTRTSRFLPMINKPPSKSRFDGFNALPNWLQDIDITKKYPCNFIPDRQNNKLSKLLKSEINNLAIPESLKNYLNLVRN
ncbi:uncharacterized protein LOC126836723 isoform X2 [Adelges cooleyi]|uniref:uncharacterized protein LOC126836723 isoform X2 n=1 Tax=Adelges cooleyi TaxID=133065 RepID=UPI0021804AFB|nr:uncharacterized protein LOC126836723 isoform X2 [Adelges cooleyi]